MKTKSLFRCQECGVTSPKWQGRCSDCSAWNSFVEEIPVEVGAIKNRSRLTDFTSEVSPLDAVNAQDFPRQSSNISELDRVLGGGIVPGSLILLGGSPGIGKSTLMIQAAAALAQSAPVLYVSGEESKEQVKLRADRLKLKSPNLFLLSETNLENILEAVAKINPKVLIVDSIQTTYRMDLASAPGSVAQVRECAAEFLRVAKSGARTVFLLGHVTKEGDIAGPRVLEHIVDTVLYFESERSQMLRILRSYKNRFGPTSEMGLFEMCSSGLIGVENPSAIFLSDHTQEAGSFLTCAMEGTRPLLFEVQALTSRTLFGLPRRMATGCDINRILILTAVLEKRLGLGLGSQDIFVNVTGGVKLKEPATDLALAAAMAGAFGDFTVNSDGILIGEVGLAGEVRSVPQVLERLEEARRHNMQWAIYPKRALREKFNSGTLECIGVETLAEAVRWLRTKSKQGTKTEK